MSTLHILPDDATVSPAGDETILQASLRAGLPHLSVCGGQGRCSTCRVRVLAGLEHCTSIREAEREIATQLLFPPDVRLACQTRVTGDVTVRRLLLDSERPTNRHEETGTRRAIGEEKKLAILFGDIQGFTPFAERLPAYDVIHVLNLYYDRVNRAVTAHGGAVNNTMGDGFLALFGLGDSGYAVGEAVAAGFELLQNMRTFETELARDYQRGFGIRLGLHYGAVIIGEVGLHRGRRLTVVGDAVNFASRIEQANKQLGTNFLLSADAYAQVKDRVRVIREADLELPGKTGRHRLYGIGPL